MQGVVYGSLIRVPAVRITRGCLAHGVAVCPDRLPSVTVKVNREISSVLSQLSFG